MRMRFNKVLNCGQRMPMASSPSFTDEGKVYILIPCSYKLRHVNSTPSQNIKSGSDENLSPGHSLLCYANSVLSGQKKEN